MFPHFETINLAALNWIVLIAWWIIRRFYRHLSHCPQESYLFAFFSLNSPSAVFTTISTICLGIGCFSISRVSNQIVVIAPIYISKRLTLNLGASRTYAEDGNHFKLPELEKKTWTLCEYSTAPCNYRALVVDTGWRAEPFSSAFSECEYANWECGLTGFHARQSPPSVARGGLELRNHGWYLAWLLNFPETLYGDITVRSEWKQWCPYWPYDPVITFTTA